jgi:hypothetical protein
VREVHLQMNYIEQKQHEVNFLSLTSLSVIEFEYLFSHFEPLWERYYRYHTLEGKKRVIISYKEHGNSLLKGTEQKLFFLLVFLKNNNLQTFQVGPPMRGCFWYISAQSIKDISLFTIRFGRYFKENGSFSLSRFWYFKAGINRP